MPRVSNVDTISSKKPPLTTSTPSPIVFDLNNKIYDILGHTKSSLSSSLVFPKVFSFSEKDDDENILLVLRPHWFTNLSWILTAIFMALVPISLTYVPLLSSFSLKYKFISILFWYLITFIVAFEKFLSWYFDVYIITDNRVVDIDFKNLIVKKFSEADIHKIQDVTSNVIGFFPTMFNYGVVNIQTAAEVPEISFENIPNPEKVIKVLQELREKKKSNHARTT